MKGWIYISALIATLVATSPISTAASSAIAETDDLASGKILPKAISQPAPTYPPSLMRSGVDGVVMVAFTVDEEGRVRDPEVENSSFRPLNPYALKAVAAWKFSPGTRNGRPAAFRLRAPVEFTGGKVEETARNTDVAVSRPVIPTSATTNADTPPAPKRKPAPVYPYEMLINGQPGWADASFVVDYTGRPLFTSPAGSSNRAFAMAVVAMVEASAYNPARKGKAPIMSPSKEHYEFTGENALDPEAKRILSELRKRTPSIISSAELDERPKVVQQVSPVYPRALKDDGLTGQAEIEFIIDRGGRVLFPRIVSATHEDFGWAAATAVSQWRFQPPHKSGQNVEVKMTVPVLFTAQKLAESD